MKIVSQEIEDYAVASSSAESKLLQELVEETQAKAKFPEMQVGHLEGSFLRLLVRLMQAKSVLEIGTFTGYSALAMAEGLPADGTVITCDIDPVATTMAKKYWAKSSHGKKIELRLGPALETLEKLTSSFDLAFVDADKENYISYWDLIIPKIKKGGLIVVDNVLWSGRVLKPTEMSDHAIVAFNEHAKSDSRVDLLMLTIRDGMTLAWKK